MWVNIHQPEALVVQFACDWDIMLPRYLSFLAIPLDLNFLPLWKHYWRWRGMSWPLCLSIAGRRNTESKTDSLNKKTDLNKFLRDAIFAFAHPQCIVFTSVLLSYLPLDSIQLVKSGEQSRVFISMALRTDTVDSSVTNFCRRFTTTASVTSVVNGNSAKRRTEVVDGIRRCFTPSVRSHDSFFHPQHMPSFRYAFLRHWCRALRSPSEQKGSLQGYNYRVPSWLITKT